MAHSRAAAGTSSDSASSHVAVRGGAGGAFPRQDGANTHPMAWGRSIDTR